MDIQIASWEGTMLSPYVFGHNLEHTRSAVNRGLSAQMLRNRKFAGKPSKNRGVAAEWHGFGDHTFFQLMENVSYTRHIGCAGMSRGNELQSQRVQNLSEGSCGLLQQDLCITGGRTYELRVVTQCNHDLILHAELTDGAGSITYAMHELPLTSGDWESHCFLLTPDTDDPEAALRLRFSDRAMVTFGAVSMMPADHFHGMRADVVRLLKEIGPSVLRWPGGNFAGEYRWKDGLLPSDMRGPLQAYAEIETQPHSHGYDFHEINTDDFIALCREVGAEPFLTINLYWNTPEESREWVEYVNGSADTEYGKKRAENGHPESYHVRFWSLGNEMGYGHMEGPMQPKDYADLAETQFRAMRAASPDIELFSSGPYPNNNWAENSAARLREDVKYISLHHYANTCMDYTSDEAIKETYQRIVKESEGVIKTARNMRASLDAYSSGLQISFDEWNFWYAWYRPSCVSEGIFSAKVLHELIGASHELQMPFCCYFQPVGEGAILIDDETARLTANGQVFSLMKVHKGGTLLRLSGAENDAAIATVKDQLLSITLINEAYDETQEFTIRCEGAIQEHLLLTSEEVTPYTFFEETGLEYAQDTEKIKVTMPPHSVGLLRIRMN